MKKEKLDEITFLYQGKNYTANLYKNHTTIWLDKENLDLCNFDGQITDSSVLQSLVKAYQFGLFCGEQRGAKAEQKRIISNLIKCDFDEI